MRKALKFVLGLLLALVLAFFGAGLVMPTLAIESSVEVEKPVETAWRVFMDGERAVEWMSGLQRMEIIAGEPAMVGSQFKLVFVENGEEMVVEEMVTTVRKHEEYGFTIDSATASGDAVVRFEDLGMRTRITLASEMQGSNPLMQSMMVIAQGFIRDRQRADLERLKRLIEAEQG